MAKTKKRSDLTVLLQVKISPDAHRRLRERAASDMRSSAAYVRHLLYLNLGLAVQSDG
jgi:hypothetical protein